MPKQFERPVVKNATRAFVGDDCAHINSDKFSARLGGNTGNVAFIHAILRQISGIRHMSTVGKGYGDVNVLGCSNQINKNIKKSADDAVFGGTDAPFVAIGLGAQAPSTQELLEVPAGTIDYIRRIQASSPGDAPNISLRGEYTYRVLKQVGLHERAVVLGCPSHLTHPNPKLGVLLKRSLARPIERVAVAPGNIVKPAQALARIEQSLAAMADRYGGGYIVQHPKDLMVLVRDGFHAVDHETVNRIRSTVRPDLSNDEFRFWFRAQARMFGSAVSWMEYLRSVDLVVGTRIHGCILAIQAGTPAVCIAVDSRQTEMCEVMRIPSIPAAAVTDGVDLDDALEVLNSWDWDAFDANRTELAGRYARFLADNGLQHSPLIERLANPVG